MRNLLLLFSAIVLAAPARAETMQTQIVSRAFLKDHGVVLHKTRNDTPMASQAIAVDAGDAKGLGKFEAAQCVVLTEPLAHEEIAAFEEKPDETRVERRVLAARAKTTFLVRGSELGRAYLVFSFSAEGAATPNDPKRYILLLEPRGSTPAIGSRK